MIAPTPVAIPIESCQALPAAEPRQAIQSTPILRSCRASRASSSATGIVSVGVRFPDASCTLPLGYPAVTRGRPSSGREPRSDRRGHAHRRPPPSSDSHQRRRHWGSPRRQKGWAPPLCGRTSRQARGRGSPLAAGRRFTDGPVALDSATFSARRASSSARAKPTIRRRSQPHGRLPVCGTSTSSLGPRCQRMGELASGWTMC